MARFYFHTLAYYSPNDIVLLDGTIAVSAGNYLYDSAAIAALPVGSGGRGDAFYGSGISTVDDSAGPPAPIYLDDEFTLGEAFRPSDTVFDGNPDPLPTYVGQTVVNGVTAPVFSYTVPDPTVVGGTVTIYQVAFPSDPGDLSATTIPGITSTDPYDFSATDDSLYVYTNYALLTEGEEFFWNSAPLTGSELFMFEPDGELTVGQMVQTSLGEWEYTGTATIEGVAYPVFEGQTFHKSWVRENWPENTPDPGDDIEYGQIVLLPDGVLTNGEVAQPTGFEAQSFKFDGSSPADDTTYLEFKFSVDASGILTSSTYSPLNAIGFNGTAFVIPDNGSALAVGEEVDFAAIYFQAREARGYSSAPAYAKEIYAGQVTTPGGVVGHAFFNPDSPGTAKVYFEDDPGDLTEVILTLPAAICFLEGTDIATPTGPRAVETLEIGAPVLTADGRTVPVKWIGRQTVFSLFNLAERLAPVRFAAGSLGDGLPHSDLTVTTDHAMLVEGVLCNAGALVNGSTITRVPLSEMGARYTVYHIETEDHEIILANGAPAETFIDNVSRRVFDNYAEFEALYGDVPEMQELPYPRAMSARQVPSWIRNKIACPKSA